MVVLVMVMVVMVMVVMVDGGDGTLLQDVIDETIPDDVIDEELENILPDFIKQLEMGGTKCK